ncbi:MAG: hypothetical protein ACPIOQ_12710 [Promethearchaeia archaeon]
MHRAASGRLLRRGPTCPPSPPMCGETAHTHACERMQTCTQLGAMYIYAQGAAPEAALCGCDGGPLVSRSACATASLLRT